jgi:hypothetical protein
MKKVLTRCPRGQRSGHIPESLGSHMAVGQIRLPAGRANRPERECRCAQRPSPSPSPSPTSLTGPSLFARSPGKGPQTPARPPVSTRKQSSPLHC